jgi:hypothetical protein
MRLLVCGGRNYDDEIAIEAALETIHEKTPITVLIQGGARGVDKLAGKWADRNGIEALVFPADWYRYNNAAGPIRNRQMLDEGKPDLVLAMPGGAGTEDMMEQARARGLRVIRPGLGLDMSHIVFRMLMGMDLYEQQSVLARALIHLCLINGWPKATVLEALGEQWDMMEKAFRKRRN